MPLDTLAMSPQVVTVGVDACVFLIPCPHVSTKLRKLPLYMKLKDKTLHFPNKMKKYNPQVQKFSNTTNIQIKLKHLCLVLRMTGLSFLADHTSECQSKHPHWQEGVTSAIGTPCDCEPQPHGLKGTESNSFHPSTTATEQFQQHSSAPSLSRDPRG